MPVPQHVFDPPFNIIRSSHAVLDVTDLKLSRDFYETTVGLRVEDADNDAVYLRGSEEHQHHSLVLRRAQAPACNRKGFKVGNEGDLYKGCHSQRLDHFNVFAAEVRDTMDFYARLGFRLTDYAEEDGPNGRIAA